MQEDVTSVNKNNFGLFSEEVEKIIFILFYF